MQTQLIENSVQQFHDAESLWFWFIFSHRMRTSYGRPANCKSRPCELVDIETLVTKLYLSGRLSEDQLKVMKEYGDRRRAPHQYIWAENKDATLWRCAMDVIEQEAIKKGWIEIRIKG